jgi:RNA polymerase sigma factor FliA
MVPRPAEADSRRESAEKVAANGGARELRSLWRRLKEHNDQAARDRLVLHFAPLVKYVAGRMSSALPAHIEEGDLISYGLLGLMNAIERFDPGRQIKFETYAVTRIKGAIIDELRSLDWVPRSVRARARQIERKSAELENKLQRAPTDEEIAGALNLSMQEFQDAITQIATSSIVALDEMWTVSSSGEPLSLIDTIGDSRMTDPAAVLDVTELRATLADAIARLPEREKIVVALYYYDGLTLREIGEVLGVTESRVSQLHTKAILRLKGRLQGDLERLHAD